MSSNTKEQLAITGISCYFPSLSGLTELCKLVFPDPQPAQATKKTESKVSDLVFQNSNLDLLIAKTIKAALADANFSAKSISSCKIYIVLNSSFNREKISLNISSFLKEEYASQAENIIFLDEKEEFSWSILSELNSKASLLLAIASNKHTEIEQSNYAAVALLLEPSSETTNKEKKVYAAFKKPGKQSIKDTHISSQISPLEISLVSSSSSELFTANSKIRQALEAVYLSAPKNMSDQEAMHKLLSKQAPWALLNCSTNLLGDYAVVSEFAALVISSLSLYLKILPASGNTSNNQLLAQELNCFYLSTASRPWIHPGSPVEPSPPRRAAVLLNDKNNTYIILEEQNSAVDLAPLRHWGSELFIFQTSSPPTLVQQLKHFINFISQHSELSLLELTLSLKDSLANQASNKANKNNCRLAVLAYSRLDLHNKLEQALLLVQQNQLQSISEAEAKVSGLYYNPRLEPTPQKLAFIMSGLGAAYPNMLADLCFNFPEVRAVFDFVERLAIKESDKSLPSRQIFPVKLDNPWGNSNQASLAMMDSAVITVLLAEWAIYTLLDNLGIKPDAIMGCSTGEFAALTMNGSINILEAAETFYKLSTAVSRSVPMDKLMDLRSMRIVAERAIITPLLKQLADKAYLGAEMAADYSLVSGPKVSMEALSKLLKEANIEFYPLPVAIPYHTPLVAGKLHNKQQEVLNLGIVAPTIESWSCSTGSKYPADADAIRTIATDLFEKPILFRSTLEAMHEQGINVFLEVGPKGGLVPFMSEVLKSKEHLALACNLSGRSGIEQLQHVLAMLFAQGFEIKFEHLYAKRRTASRATLFEINSQAESITATEITELVKRDNNADLIVANYLQSMSSLHQQLMQSQEKMLLAYLESCLLTDEVTQTKLAFLSKAEVEVEKQEGTARARFHLKLSEDLFLCDHAIGGTVNSKQGTKVSLLPLMVALEIMAETATLLSGLHKVRTIKNIRAYKRIRVDENGFQLEARAKLQAKSTNSIFVEIYQVESADFQVPDKSAVLMSCEVEFATAYQPATVKSLFPKDKESSAKLQGKSLYGTGGMFHGPRMRSVESLSKISSKTITAQIQHKPASDWFASQANEQETAFLLDPLLLDNASQLVLYQLLEHDYPVSALLPFHIDEISFFNKLHPPTGETVQGEAYLHSMNERGTEADIEISDTNGELLLKISRIHSRAIILPESLRAFIHEPSKILLAKEFCLKGKAKRADKTNFISIMRAAELPQDETVMDWLTDYILNPQEKREWVLLSKHLKRRSDWIIGRIAAKDAIRVLVKEHFGLEICPAEIEIVRSEDGSPLVKGTWCSQLSWVPQIAISHSSGIAVAVASKSTLPLRPGVDIEEIKEREEGFCELAFTLHERQYLESLSGFERTRWETIIWTAKEAVAKSVGTGLRGNPQRFEMEAIDKNSSSLFIKLRGCQCEDLPISPEHRFLVNTEQIENMAFSLTLSE